MCGHDLPRPSLGGALAVLSAPHDSRSSMPTSPAGEKGSDADPFLFPSGKLVFHSQQPGTTSAVATHATFTPHAFPGPSSGTAGAAAGTIIMADYVVGIHASGDLLTPASRSPVLYQFGLGEGAPRRTDMGAGPCGTEVRLARPLPLGVGGDGIIGRRVTVWSRRGRAAGSDKGDEAALLPVAEGIVGFN
ncbi:hypothetical protein DL766_007506 [Monosporascus sp. MC13-8B]|uniref:Uncharacterized protein n=1 Tax=Monosporascus cannonballus TaxID=155416 RepID=A0ABY0H938_9PEZI|nr:hypothetical protein DL762_003910 [Monosporascus cannonballus]RYO94855.1 hypothetical protein DL763_003959 [Monosporascus cannonballus]RYP23469.1 hypothetical protein DL766_007506 [Monosporascus sp. MC13-8B]